MIKYTAIAAITLDGKIAQNSHQFSYDWTSKEDKIFFQKEIKKFDAVLVGSNTFKTAKKSLLKRNTVVLTSKIKTTEEKYPHVWFCNYKTVDIRKFFQNLKVPSFAKGYGGLPSKNYKKVGKIAIVGGSKVYGYCLEKNLIDELYLTVEPIVFGKGINLFTDEKSKLNYFKLLSVKKLGKQGTLLLRYRNINPIINTIKNRHKFYGRR